MRKVKTYLGILGIVLALLLALEAIAYAYLSAKNKGQPFLINTILLQQKYHQELKGFGYALVDPLLGWGYTAEALERLHLTTEGNCLVLPSLLHQATPLRVLITGGSTTDVGLKASNWPTELQRMLADSGVCATLYIGAVGGYSSGQEVLKVIRDGVGLQPDVHISYSGANEFISPAYVSRQEQTFYRQAFGGTSYRWLMPNLMAVMRSGGSSATVGLELYEEPKKDPADNWVKNMRLLHVIATANHYVFVGILQPLLATAQYHQPEVEQRNERYVKANQAFYPMLKNHADTTVYLRNWTAVFDTATGSVFVDDCHLTDSYQSTIARQVYLLLKVQANR